LLYKIFIKNKIYLFNFIPSQRGRKIVAVSELNRYETSKKRLYLAILIQNPDLYDYLDEIPMERADFWAPLL